MLALLRHPRACHPPCYASPGVPTGISAGPAKTIFDSQHPSRELRHVSARKEVNGRPKRPRGSEGIGGVFVGLLWPAHHREVHVGKATSQAGFRVLNRLRQKGSRATEATGNGVYAADMLIRTPIRAR
jgi:hypothetical protein